MLLLILRFNIIFNESYIVTWYYPINKFWHTARHLCNGHLGFFLVPSLSPTWTWSKCLKPLCHMSYTGDSNSWPSDHKSCNALPIWPWQEVLCIVYTVPLSAFSSSSCSFLRASSARLAASNLACSVHVLIISTSPAHSKLLPSKYSSLKLRENKSFKKTTYIAGANQI